MNLNIYDDGTNIVDKTKTWIDTKYKRLFSKELSFRKYYTIGKRYNNILKYYDFYIIMSDDVIPNKQCIKTKVDNYGRIDISLRNIWNDLGLINCIKDMNVNIIKVENDDVCDVYYLEI